MKDNSLRISMMMAIFTSVLFLTIHAAAAGPGMTSNSATPGANPSTRRLQSPLQRWNGATRQNCTSTQCTTSNLVVSGEAAFGNTATLDPSTGINGSQTITDTNGGFYGIYNNLNLNTTGDATAGGGYFSIIGYSNTEPGNPAAIGNLIGGYFGAQHNGSGYISNSFDMAGLGSDTENVGGGTVEKMGGVEPYLYTGAGSTTSNMWAVVTSTENAGTVTNMAGVDSLFDYGNTGTITNVYGIRVEGNIWSNGGPVENFYGLKIDDAVLGPRPADNSWAIKTGKGLVEFGDVVKMDPSPFAALPSCAAATEGAIHPVNDSVSANWGAAVIGGGGNHVLAYCNGTEWVVK